VGLLEQLKLVVKQFELLELELFLVNQ
jgi:hypothetical protein